MLEQLLCVRHNSANIPYIRGTQTAGRGSQSDCKRFWWTTTVFAYMRENANTEVSKLTYCHISHWQIDGCLLATSIERFLMDVVSTSWSRCPTLPTGFSHIACRTARSTTLCMLWKLRISVMFTQSYEACLFPRTFVYLPTSKNWPFRLSCIVDPGE